MVQFYFLSVLLNILIGVILITTDNSTKISIDDEFDDSSKKSFFKSSVNGDSIFSNETFCLVTSVICLLIGLIKLFFTFSKSEKNIILIGDFLPAIFGIVGGGIVLLDFYSKSFAEHELPDFVENIFFNNKKYIGFGCLIVAILHFAIPGVLFF